MLTTITHNPTIHKLIKRLIVDSLMVGDIVQIRVIPYCTSSKTDVRETINSWSKYHY